MHKHRPSQPRTGWRAHRAGGIAAIALVLVLVIGVAAVIAWRFGGGDSDEDPAPSADARVVTTPAKDLVPDLSSLGYRLVDEFSMPFDIPGQDQFRRAFARPEAPGRLAVVDVTVHETLEAATTAYALAAEQWGNPPPGVFTGIERFEETESPGVGDQQQSYVSTNVDGAGNRAWTDVYRAGNVVVIVQVLDEGNTDQLELRTEIARRTIENIG